MKDLQFFGAGQDALPAWLLGKDDNEFEVYLCNHQAYELWERLCTQWRVAGLGGELGLDYNVAFSIMDRLLLPGPEQLEVLDRLRLIESGYLSVRNEQAKKQRRKQQQQQNHTKARR